MAIRRNLSESYFTIVFQLLKCLCNHAYCFSTIQENEFSVDLIKQTNRFSAIFSSLFKICAQISRFIFRNLNSKFGLQVLFFLINQLTQNFTLTVSLIFVNCSLQNELESDRDPDLQLDDIQ